MCSFNYTKKEKERKEKTRSYIHEMGWTNDAEEFSQRVRQKQGSSLQPFEPKKK